MLRALSLAAVLACLLLPSTAPAQTKIQPGASMEICTLNFIYDGVGNRAGKVYVGTAAHCVENIGDVVNDGDGDPIGKVAFIGDAESASTDYAFVEIYESELARVDPSVKGHPQYPTGFTVPEETAVGDVIQISGYGIVFGETQTTQEKRQGILQSDDAEVYAMSGPSVNGDSGGPFVHVETGKALGIVSRYGFETASTDYGPTLQGILDKAAKGGFPVTMRLAGQSAPTPPAPPPAEPAPSPTPTPTPTPAASPSPGASPRPGSPPAQSQKPRAKKKKKKPVCKTKKQRKTKRCKAAAKKRKRR